jgi:hypothetical protein
MTPDPLQQLWETAKALPGESLASLPALPVWEDAPARPAHELPRWRAEVAAFMRGAADAMEPLLGQALKASWDQMVEVPLLDAALRDRAVKLRLALQGLGRHTRDPSVRAAALESLLMLDAVLGILAVLEDRLTMLAGLRRESATPALTLDGRPFLDVAAALRAAAEVWA